MPSVANFISRRYLFGGERRALVTVIAMIAVAGVSIGVAALIMVIGVMDGAERDLFGKIVSLFPHLKIEAVDGEPMADPEPALRAARALPGVIAAEPVAQKEALIFNPSSRKELVAGRLLATLIDGESQIFKFRSVKRSDPSKKGAEGLGEFEALLGSPLAEKLGVKPGDRVLAIVGLGSQRAARDKPTIALTVAGVYDSGYYSFDSLTVVISPETAREAFGAASADFVHVKVERPFDTELKWRTPGGLPLPWREYTLARSQFAAQSKLGPAWKVGSFLDEQGSFYQSLKLQKLALFLILMLIIIVAGFNIICTLIIMVIEKTREIGILKAIGSPDGLIRATFLRVGLIIGLMGTSLGVVIGVGGALLLKYVIKFKMPPRIYDFDRLPVSVELLTIAIIVASAMGACAMAAFFPAVQASRMNPIESLRRE